MLIAIVKEELVELLKHEIECWESIGGGPNYDAFPFNPKKVDIKELTRLGYFANKDAWIAGVRIKQLKEFLAEVESTDQIRI